MTESDKMRRRTRWYMAGAFAVAAIAFDLIYWSLCGLLYGRVVED